MVYLHIFTISTGEFCRNSEPFNSSITTAFSNFSIRHFFSPSRLHGNFHHGRHLHPLHYLRVMWGAVGHAVFKKHILGPLWSFHKIYCTKSCSIFFKCLEDRIFESPTKSKYIHTCMVFQSKLWSKEFPSSQPKRNHGRPLKLRTSQPRFLHFQVSVALQRHVRDISSRSAKESRQHVEVQILFED